MLRCLSLVVCLCVAVAPGPAVAAPCAPAPPLDLPVPPPPVLAAVDGASQQLVTELATTTAQELECVAAAAFAHAARHRLDALRAGGAVDRLVAAWVLLGAAAADDDPAWIGRAADVFGSIDRADLQGPPQAFANLVDERLDAWRGPPGEPTIEDGAHGLTAWNVQPSTKLDKALGTWWEAHPGPSVFELTVYDPRDGHLELAVRGARLRIDAGGEILVTGVRTGDRADRWARSLGPSGRWRRGPRGTNALLLAVSGSSLLFSVNGAAGPTLELSEPSDSSVRLRLGRGMRVDTLTARVAD